jgi:hypothetical protein
LITYQEETDFDKFIVEGKPLFDRNNEELDFFGLSVDVNTPLYRSLRQVDCFKVYSIREDGKLIGYSSFILQPHLQHKEHWQANQDVLYIVPEKRGNGIAFMKWCENELVETRNISFVFRSVTKFKDWSLILKRLNYEEVETIYMKDLRR